VRPFGPHNHFFTGLSYAVALNFRCQIAGTHYWETRGALWSI